ncbi:hypothetical protein [Roseofilum capinflatum]|uniref:Uncharacterized protein n=1 Tax=Roseofilum capinflatum BLCC-M114 TaxID=3022440 RepID=A0ABT7BCM7_9CYAN|nr:hypothetical protein [Roseofilum capinflatum]MDJ1176048.1 hypothetical protein [Roseofilum capinflatum BLCC-M114]
MIFTGRIWVGVGVSEQIQLDRSTRTLDIIEYNWWIFKKSVKSYPFSEISVHFIDTQTQDEDGYNGYEIKIMLPTGSGIIMDYGGRGQDGRESIWRRYQQISKIIGKKS